MNIKLLCRINGVIVFLNGLSALVAPGMWFSMAGLESSVAGVAAAQGLGVAAISLGIISWRTVDIAGDAINSYGQLFGGIHVLFIILTVYQSMTGLFTGPPVYFNLILSLVLAIAFFYYSRKSE